MAEEGRLRYDGVESYLASTLEAGSNLIELETPLIADGNVPIPTLNPGEYLALTILDPNYVLQEIVHLTSYTQGATTGIVDRGQEGTTTQNHGAGAKVVHSPTTLDFLIVQDHDKDPGAHEDSILAIAKAEAANAVRAHEAASDPHPQYVNKATPQFDGDVVIPSGRKLIIRSGATLLVEQGGSITVDGTLSISNLGSLVIDGKRLIISNAEPTGVGANTVWIQTFG